ncbi:MAG: carbohydrate ABC transporter permease [Roseburia sp.]|nr:carbohydrate ABC transporter permease [Roseburia sp.]
MRKNHKTTFVMSLILTAICVIPFVYVMSLSLRDTEGGLTLKYYYEVFLAQAQYLLRFWKSLAISLCIAAGQVVVSVLAGFGFAKCKFPGKDIMFFALLILMIIPLQVTLVPNYIILDEMEMLNTYYALILPAIFVPLGTFIMTQSFKSVPDEVIEAARLDGCTTIGVILRIVTPMNKSGLVCTMLLSFLDGWNLVEQPLVYLKEFADYPISVALASSPPGDSAIQLACCLLVTLPPLFLFSYFNKELVEGIAIGGEK